MILLWVLMAVLAAAAAVPVLVPLFRKRSTVTAAAAAGSIYRDQLAEIERDRARGLIADGEAEAARTEVARRLLKASEAAAGAVAAPAAVPWRPRAAAATVIAMPVLALGVYLAIGSPGLPDQPLAARLAAPVEKQDPQILVAKLEGHLAVEPDDATGWEFLARIEESLGHFDNEARALGNLIRLRGASVPLQTAYGEALTRANGGLVTKEALAAFQAGNKLDPGAIGPRFFLALAMTQAGRRDEAIAAWHSLLVGAPSDAPWVDMAHHALAALEGAPAGPPAGAAPAAAGPTAADVQAAQALSPDQRLAMINGMVGQLAARLESDPSDADGWAKLLRSYMVLGRSADAKAALAKARTALAGKSDLLARVEAEAKAVGVE